MNLLKLLKEEPKARERSNKNKAIGYIVWDKYDLDHGITKTIMADIVGEILSKDREWRKILEENPDLRGSDYDKKDMLVKSKMVELGYAKKDSSPTEEDTLETLF